MSNIRLQTTNTESARRTIKVNPFIPKHSMSSEGNTSNLKQSAGSKGLEKRLEYFRSKES